MRYKCVTIIEAFIGCTVERFRMEFFMMRPIILDQFEMYNGLSQDEVLQLQDANGYFTYRKLLDRASNSYQTLIDQKLWGPNVGVRDRTAAPEVMTAVEVNALIQKQMARNKKFDNKGSTAKGNSNGSTNSNKPVVCFYCNEPGHYKNACPKLKNKGSKFVQKNTWKYRAPNSGDPQTKSVGGVEYHWC